jgi:two-component system response regulator GlrR
MNPKNVREEKPEAERSRGARRGEQAESWDGGGRRREDRIVGASEATRQLVARAAEAARTDLMVLLVGPPGSDKELVARAIHGWSARRELELEILSCPGVPPALQRREVFGCGEDVYAALPSRYEGALDRNSAGTLVLEDVDALRDDVASALWKAMADRELRHVGEEESRPLSTRVIATVCPGREPRLETVPHHEIRIRPLAERPEDVLPLAAHYLRVFSEPVGFTADARASLQAEPWRGDVRELRERVRYAVRLAGHGAISAETLSLAGHADQIPSFAEAKRAFETRYVAGLLERCGGNISRAARLARKDRKDFYAMIRRTGVDPSRFRP